MLDYTDEMFKNSEYEDIHKPKLIETIEKIIVLVKKARSEGFLTLEDIFKEETDEFRKIVGSLVIDGVNHDVQFIFGMNMIRTTKVRGFELRDMMLWNTGMVMIAQGHPAGLINQILYSMIGIYKYESKFFEVTRKE